MTNVLYMQHVLQHARLSLLRTLAESPDYSANSSILDDVLDQQLGLALPRHLVDAELRWLATQGLVTLEEPVPKLLMAKLTKLGLDVARGQATVSGVKRPSPGG